MAYPPWALFPFEVAFKLVLAFQPSADDALHHLRSTFAYRRIRVRPIFAVRRAPCRVQVLCARDPSHLGNPTIPRRAAASYEVAAQVGRVPVASVDIAAFEHFGFAGGRSSSPSQTIRRPALLVECPFGHCYLRTPRGVRPKPVNRLREGVI